ncbi:MAG: DegV family protein [Herpetosiphon sp.]
MAAVKIVTDSTADLSSHVLRELDIEVVPLYINIGNETYRDWIDILPESYARIVAEHGGVPSTTAPPTTMYEQTYRRLSRNYEAIISIHMSSHLSSAFKAAARAREKLSPSLAKIDVVDTHSASLGVGLTVMAAARMAQQGASSEEIVQAVQHRVQHTHMLYFVDTIEHLERSGRISLAPALMSSMARIKPLLLLDHGQIVPYERTRTRAKAIDGLFTFVEDFPHVAEVAVVSNASPEDVDKVLDKIDILFSRQRVLVGNYGPAITVHLGPGAMGIVVYEG